MTVGFWSLAYGLAVGASGTPDGSADPTEVSLAAVALSVGLVPFVLLTVALLSRRKDAFIWVLAGMGLALSAGLPSLAFGNPLASLIAGYAAAAVVTLAREDRTTWHNRAIAAASVSVVSLAGMQVAFVAFAWVAPALPFTAMGIADLFTTPRPVRVPNVDAASDS